MDQLSREETWELYKSLPPEIKDTMTSEDTGEAIWNICKLYKIKNTDIVKELVGQTLMGLLPPQFFKDTIKEELKIDEDTAKKVSMEIEHYILNQVKEELDELYEEVTGGKKEKKDSQENKKTSDHYREPVR